MTSSSTVLVSRSERFLGFRKNGRMAAVADGCQAAPVGASVEKSLSAQRHFRTVVEVSDCRSVKPVVIAGKSNDGLRIASGVSRHTARLHGGTTMTKLAAWSDQTRRSFVKTVAYVAPAILTLKATPALAQQASNQPKGNNGVGNGLDPQPPGNPPINDGPGTSPGNPGNQGGPS